MSAPRRMKGEPRGGRGKPLWLAIHRKSPHMQRWLLRNPWIHPFIVFVFSASKIQKISRGFLVRKQGKLRDYVAWRKRVRHGERARTQVSVKGKSPQLDKYLGFMDKANSGVVCKPHWLDGGYSVWCVVRLQAWYRMTKPRRHFMYTSHIIHHIAAMIIQAAIKAKLIRLRNKRLIQETAKISRIPPHRASVRIQLVWRRFCNRRIFRYYRDLILNKLQGAPQDLLRTIVPREADFLDRAAGVVVRFRLGGAIFPPKVYFKVYTHRGVCDVNSFAPRVYAKEKMVEAFQQNVQSVYIPKDRQKYSTGIRVGGSYFGTKVLSNTSTDEWYRREENNDWRPIASQSFEEILTPPWLQEAPVKKEPAPFHFSRLKRKTDILKEKKRRRRNWMMKAYTLAGVELDKLTDDASLSSAELTTGKTAMTATRAQETHNFLYQHTSHSQEIGSVTQAQLETIYSPAASPAISRGQTPQEHRRGSKAKGYEGGARTYSQDYGAGGGDEVIGVLGTVKGAIGESKAAEGDRLGPLEDHDSISESLAFLSLSGAEHESRSLELDVDPDMQKFHHYMSSSVEGERGDAALGTREDPITFPNTSVMEEGFGGNARRNKANVVRPDILKKKGGGGTANNESKNDFYEEKERIGGLKLPPIDSAQVRKAVETKIKAIEDNEDLLNWSMALDYEEYNSNWSRLGTSLPSSSQPSAFYN